MGNRNREAAELRTKSDHHLAVYDVSQVERLLDDVHEGLSQHFGHNDVRRGEQAVGAEGLNQQQLVQSLADGSWTHNGRVGG